MWWILQFLAICGITAVHTFNRWAGIQGMEFITKWLINAGAQVCIAPLFILSYALAPGFFQPWFLGTALIGVIGFAVSLIFFGEVITITKIMGAVLSIIGAVLLVL